MPGLNSRAEAGALRRDLRRLEDALRQSGTTGHRAAHCLIALAFIKWYEEIRELRGASHRFTAEGFSAFHRSLPSCAARGGGNALSRLLDDEFGDGAPPDRAGLRESVAPAEGLGDRLLYSVVFPVLDRHRFDSTEGDPLDAVLDAVLRREDKDARIGQFFTPGAVARFAVDVLRPELDEVILDPAAGTGGILACIAGRVRARPAVGDAPVHGPAGIGRVIGCDINPWAASIARMRLYMRGGDAGDVRVADGLALADRAVFGAPLRGGVDACVAHPPLGAVSRRGAVAESERPSAGVPAELGQRLPAQSPSAQWTGDSDVPLDHVPNGARGHLCRAGALFLESIWSCLKSTSDTSAPGEWRGGRLGIIVDEGILNTAEHERTRASIRRHYYVKAVFSFGRDAFWYEARTTARSSLLYLVKKEVGGEDQSEPTFFAHAERIGTDRSGRAGPSDLPDVLAAYERFEAVVRAGWSDEVFDGSSVRRALAGQGLPAGVHVQWPGKTPGRGGDRMDYAAAASVGVPPEAHPLALELGDVVRCKVRHPEESSSGCYTFATIDRTTGEVRTLGVAATRYPVRDLRVVHAGDVVVSGIDLVNGAAGYAYPEADGLVLSREFYTLELKDACAETVDPRFLALLLRTPRARRAVAGIVTGTTGRTRIRGAGALLALRLPPLPSIAAQHEILAGVERARAAEREAEAASERVLAAANRHWKVARR